MSSSLTWSLGGSLPGIVPSTVRRLTRPKSPTDLIPITGDFRAALNGINCDALDPTFTPETSVSRNDGGTVDFFVVGTPFINTDNTRVSLWLAGGSIGFEYLVSITIMSDDGQELTRSFIMPVAVR